MKELVKEFMDEHMHEGGKCFVSNVFYHFKRWMLAEKGTRVFFSVDSFGRYLDKEKFPRHISRIAGKQGSIIKGWTCGY